MGNQLSPPSKPGVEHSGELVNVVVKETIGGGRLFKSLLCLHDNGGLVVVKVFYKRKDTPSLVLYRQQLEAVRNVLLGLPCPHVWPMQHWWETPNAAYMMRQHFFANLYDRLSTRPFLTSLEKRWITFQLLHGVSQAHAAGVAHGDIKCENVMVTSWNWVFLTDFASYKPTYLPADNPADFSYYFDTGGRRRCYLAPERFFEGSAAAINTSAPLQPDMDIFSLGCVIAELWLGGDRAFFDLSKLLAYRRGEYDPSVALAGVEPDIAELVMHMIQRNPGDRWTADHYLTSWPRKLFPVHFSDVLHPFFNSLLDLDPDARLAAVAAHYEELAAAVQGGRGRIHSTVDASKQQVSPRDNASPSPAAMPTVLSVAASDHHVQPAASAAAAGKPVGVSGASGAKAAIAGIVPGAGAAAGNELLAEMDSLLANVNSVQRHLMGVAAAGLTPAAAEDDGICIDDARQEEGTETGQQWPDSGSLASTKAAPVPASGATEGVLVAAAAERAEAEEWYEFQVRDASNQWVPYAPPGTSNREAVTLPADGGWCWAGEWQLLPMSGGTRVTGHHDPSGTTSSSSSGQEASGCWQYSAVGPDCTGIISTISSSSWSAGFTEHSRLRRRRWIRQRLRSGCSADPSGAAAVLPAKQPRLQAAVPGSDSRQQWPAYGSAVSRDEGMVLLAVLLCTLLRGSKLHESKRAAIMLLARSALQCDDDVRLQTVVPYLLTQASDPHAAVRMLALRCVVQVMCSLSRLPPADAKVYHDYLLPSLSLLPNDPEESVRVTYAQAVADLAAAAHEHLLGLQYGSAADQQAQQGRQQQQQQSRSSSSNSLTAEADTSAAGSVDAGMQEATPSDTAAATPEPASGLAGAGPGGVSASWGETAVGSSSTAAVDADVGPAPAEQSGAAAAQPVVRYDSEMAAVRGAVEKVVLELVTGIKSSPDIKRGLLSHAHQLGLFFGRREIIDQLLPLLITCLNDQVEWRLRGSFFGAIAAVGPQTGHLDAFLLPCLEQALQDSEPAVVCDAVRCLAHVCSHLRKRSMLKGASQVAPLLRHRDAAVRHAAVAFIAAVAQALPPADIFTQLAVMVAKHLQQQPLLLTDEEHLAACLQSTVQSPGRVDSPSKASHLRILQHSTTTMSAASQLQGSAGSRSLGLQLQFPPLQQQPPLTSTQSMRERRATAGDAFGQAAVGGGREHGAFGSLLSRPADAAMRHTTNDRPSRVGAATPGGLNLTGGAVSHGGTLLALQDELNIEGSSLLLRPSAPVYCLDLDPAATGGVGAISPLAAGPGSETGEVALPGFGSSDWPKGAPSRAAGVAGIGSRCGYRADGFGPPNRGSSNAASPASAAGTKAAYAQNATVLPGGALSPPNSLSCGASCAVGPGSNAAGKTGGSLTIAKSPACTPGGFWLGQPSGPGAAPKGGMLTGFNTKVAVGPGGLVIGPSAAGSGVGLRPRPKSSHTAAVESIGRRRAVLQEHYNALAEALARDPASVEAGDRQQMERLAATLHRLNLQPGGDVRCPAALLTYKMAAVTSRAGPAATTPGGAGDPSSSIPAVYDAVSAAITTGIGQHLPGHEGAAGPSWRPRGVLASHLQEHRAAVNCLATSNNGALLLSGSDDETVKVWDVRRLERDVSFASRLTYAGQSGRITGVCAVLDGASVASASASGSLHVWRVEYTSKPGGWAPDKYRGITAVRQLSPGEGAVLHVLPWANHPSLLLYASQRGGVHCCDLRCAKDAWHVPPAPSLGLVQQLVADPSGQHWLAQGTSRGWVCLWDVRFLLCVNSWQHPQRYSIQAMAAAVAAPPRLGLSQGSLPHAGVPLLYVGAGDQEVGLWDVLDGRCHQVLRVLSPDESQLGQPEPPSALRPPVPSVAHTSKWMAGAMHGMQQQAEGRTNVDVGGMPVVSGQNDPDSSLPQNSNAQETDIHSAIDQINSPHARLAGITAMLPLPSGALLTGGADRCIRFWEPCWAERSYIVSGPVWPDDTAIMDPNTNKLQVPSHVYRYSRHTYNGVPVVEERCVGEPLQLVTPDSSPDLGSKLRMHDLVHANGITQLLSVEGASRLLVSAGKDGCIKVWR